jgi:tetratricopeptide (TPR) repeat protein
MLGLYDAKNQSDRVNALTKVHANSSLHLFLVASLLIQTCGPVFAANETKRTFTHQVDIRPGKEDALIDIFKPLSTQFSTESRSLGALYTMGEVFFYQKRYKESMRSFSEVLSKAKRGTYLNDATKVRLAESYLLEGNYEMALKTAQEVSSSSNRFIGAESWYTTARAYLAQNKIDKAEEALQRVSSINPAYDSLLKMNLVKGLIAFQKGAYPEALTHFSKNTDDIPSIYYTIASH